jgi:hypothetical protein
MMDVCFTIFAFIFWRKTDETIPKTSKNPKHPGKPWFNDDCKTPSKIAKRPNDGSELCQLDLDAVDGFEDVFVGVFEDVVGCDEYVWLEDV